MFKNRLNLEESHDSDSGDEEVFEGKDSDEDDKSKEKVCYVYKHQW